MFTSSIASVEFYYTLFGRTLLPDYAKGGKNGPQHPQAGDDDDDDNKQSPGTLLTASVASLKTVE